MAFSRTLYWLALCLLPLSVWADKAETCDRLYDAGKYREAMTCYMQPDVRNDPGMMNRIGYMHNEGQGVPVDIQEALRELGENNYTEEEIRLVRIKFLSEIGN